MKDSFIEFYVQNFCIIDSDEKTDLSFVPAISRRRLSKLDKYGISAMKKCWAENIEYVIFSSQNGEIERLLKIIEQYSEDGEVSPNTFAGSVHNYPAGFFLLSEKKSVPYTALSSGSSSISTGLIFAAVSKYNNVLYCFTDTIKDKTVSLCLHINRDCGDKYKIELKSNKDSIDNCEEFINLFNHKISKLSTPLFEIERT